MSSLMSFKVDIILLLDADTGTLTDARRDGRSQDDAAYVRSSMYTRLQYW